MLFQERFKCRKVGTVNDIKTVTACFGIIGLYGLLDAEFEGNKAYEKAALLDRGYEVQIGAYKVKKDFDFYSSLNY